MQIEGTNLKQLQGKKSCRIYCICKITTSTIRLSTKVQKRMKEKKEDRKKETKRKSH